MHIRFYCRKIDESHKKFLEEYVTDKKLKRLVRLLQHGSLELANLTIHSAYCKRHKEFFVELDLKFAKNKLVAGETSRDITRSFDIALERLVGQVRKLENLKHKS